MDAGSHSITAAIDATTKGLAVSGSGVLNIGGALTTSGTGAYNTPSVIKGAAGIVLSGTGSWTDSSYSYVNVGSVFGTGTLTINGSATLDWTGAAGLCIAAFTSGETGKVVQTGGTVKTPTPSTGWNCCAGPGMIMGNVGASASTAEYDLNGGTLVASSIYNIRGAGTGLLPPVGSVVFRFNGGVLQASQPDSTDSNVVAEGCTNLMGNLTHAYVGLGGAKIDVATFGCGIGQALEHDPALGVTLDGGLHAMSTGGAGTLALYKFSTFTGPLVIDTGVTVNLGYTGTQRVASVSIGGVNQGTGTFGVGYLNPGGAFTGTGTVTVLASPPPTPVLPASSLSLPGGVPTFTGIATVSGYTYYLVWKNDLTDASWTPILSGTISTGSPITLTDPSPAATHRFYRVEDQ